MADIEVSYDPISINSGPITVDVTGLNDIEATLTIPKPIELDTKLTLIVPDPIKTDSKWDSQSVIDTKSAIDSKSVIDTKSAIDLQPVAIDQCLRLSLAPLPATRICFPNRQRIGLTLFGVEVFGLTLDGDAEVVIGPPHRETHIVGGEARALHADHGHHDHDHHPGDPGPGLRIRLGA